jgi:hypothetical protein
LNWQSYRSGVVSRTYCYIAYTRNARSKLRVDSGKSTFSIE